jgi:hypothetical protein
LGTSQLPSLAGKIKRRRLPPSTASHPRWVFPGSAPYIFVAMQQGRPFAAASPPSGCCYPSTPVVMFAPAGRSRLMSSHHPFFVDDRSFCQEASRTLPPENGSGSQRVKSSLQGMTGGPAMGPQGSPLGKHGEQGSRRKNQTPHSSGRGVGSLVARNSNRQHVKKKGRPLLMEAMLSSN